jgi:hypothetical protein
VAAANLAGGYRSLQGFGRSEDAGRDNVNAEGIGDAVGL